MDKTGRDFSALWSELSAIIIVVRADDGTRQSVERYNLRLMVEPDDQSAAENAKYTCFEFTMQKDDGPEVTIPALEGWSDRRTGITFRCSRH